MRTAYWFRCSIGEGQGAESVQIIFAGSPPLDLDDIATAVAESSSERLAPSEICLLLRDEDAASISKVLSKDHPAFDAVSSARPGIHILGYNRSGTITDRYEISESDLICEAGFFDNVRRQGLTHLLRNNGGMLEAGPTSHFVKPSQRLSKIFIRAADAFTHGAELFFAAFWLLPLLTEDIRQIHIDTSALMGIVMAAFHLRGYSGQSIIPSVQTFSSYEKLESHPFNLDQRELIIISASQSGSLAKALQRKTSNVGDIITVFSLSGNVVVGRVLCDLSSDNTHNPNGYPIEKRIEFRSDGYSRAIRVIGEQFSAEHRPANQVVPAVSGIDKAIRSRLAGLVGGRVFSCNRSQPQDKEKGLWLDMNAFLGTTEAKKWLAETVNRIVPATTKVIAHADDDDSRALTDSLIYTIEKNGGALKSLKKISLKEMEISKETTSEANPIVIVVGVAGRGRELLSASRALREFAPNSYRIYVTAAMFAPDHRLLRVLESNIKWGGHHFERMLEVCTDRYDLNDAWKLEIEFLQKFEDDLTDDLLGRKNDLLQNSTGLVDNLFWKDISGSRLKLRANFAFWPATCHNATQADVFATMATVLSNLRSHYGIPFEERLINDAQTHTVLSPETFLRFNDGVIQASILRAARPIELNYSESFQQSGAIVDIICDMVKFMQRPQGEALSEFLLAIIIGRLALHRDQWPRLILTLKEIEPSAGTLKWLAVKVSADLAKRYNDRG